MNTQPRREPATMDSLAYLLEQILDETIRTRQAIEEQAPEGPALYCPPDEHCPGGVRLMKHAPKYWKNDGDDKDRFYHPLDQRDYWTFQGDGAFHGSTVKNHNVWRSEAVTEGREDVDATTGEITSPSREQAIADAFNRLPQRDVRQPAKPDEPMGGAPETMRNTGHYMTACLKELKMGRESVLALYGAQTINDLPGLMEPYGSWQALFEDTKERAKNATVASR